MGINFPTWASTVLYLYSYTVCTVHLFTCHHTNIHTYIHTYIHTHTYIHIYIHIYIHTYIQTYIHTYIHACTHTTHTQQPTLAVQGALVDDDDAMLLLSKKADHSNTVNAHTVSRKKVWHGASNGVLIIEYCIVGKGHQMEQRIK